MEHLRKVRKQDKNDNRVDILISEGGGMLLLAIRHTFLPAYHGVSIWSWLTTSCNILKIQRADGAIWQVVAMG